jgi:hypothetical protein
MLISQQPCGKVVMARVRRLRLAQGQTRQTKSNKENRYVIKIVRFKTGKEIRFLRFARTKGCTKPFHWPLISYSIIILILLVGHRLVAGTYKSSGHDQQLISTVQ